MKRLAKMIAPFAGAIMFFAVNAIAGLKPAIAATVALVAINTGQKIVRRRKPDRLFLGLSGLSVVLGLVDLTMATPFLMLWEGVATNLVFAAIFAFGASRRRPLVQDFAERATGRIFPDELGIVRFFRIFTWAWATYFLIRAIFCAATALTLPLAEALAARTVFASVTMVVMILVSMRGKAVYFWCVRRNWLADPLPHNSQTI